MEALAVQTQAEAMKGLSEAERQALADMLIRIKTNINPAEMPEQERKSGVGGGGSWGFWYAFSNA